MGIPHNIGPDFITQCTAEKLVERKNARGVPVKVWHRIHKDNHLGDCEKIQLVQGYLLARELKTPAQPTPQPTKPAPAPKQSWVTGNFSGGGWAKGWR